MFVRREGGGLGAKRDVSWHPLASLLCCLHIRGLNETVDDDSDDCINYREREVI